MTENEKILRAFFDEVWNTSDVDAADAFLAPVYTIHSDPGDPWDGQSLNPEGFKKRLIASRAPVPDLKFEVIDTLGDGDRVAVSWVMRGTQTGPLGDLEATGRAIEAKGLTIYYFENKKIPGHWQVVDRLSVMAQLGLLGNE